MLGDGLPPPTSEAASESVIPTSSSPKKRGRGRAAKGDGKGGLRHFSLMVCQKLEEKKSTTYTEVADELVIELSKTGGGYDHKNIRRRVYDALNVLMAMDIIEKDKTKKVIRWLGLPTDTEQAIRGLEQEITEKQQQIAQKKKFIQELLSRQIALRNLVKRNSHAESSTATTNDRLKLPFVLINAPRTSHVNCEMLEDKSQYFFEFDSPFLINEDIEILRLMGMGKASQEEIEAIVPKELLVYLEGGNDENENPSKKIKIK